MYCFFPAGQDLHRPADTWCRNGESEGHGMDLIPLKMFKKKRFMGLVTKSDPFDFTVSRM